MVVTDAAWFSVCSPESVVGRAWGGALRGERAVGHVRVRGFTRRMTRSRVGSERW